MLAPFTSSAGSLKSEANYPINVDATILHGSDYLRTDPAGTHIRLDVNSVWKDKGGELIKFSYTGVIELTAGSAAVLQGKGVPKTTEFGDIRKSLLFLLDIMISLRVRQKLTNYSAVTHVVFEAGNETLGALEKHIYVASGRFVIEEGKNVTVEYKISQVAA
jgi:hypothetical protein